MYSAFPAVEIAEAGARAPGSVVSRDRDLYIPYFEAAEAYAAKKGLVVGGRSATLLLLGEKFPESENFYEFYSQSANADARALASAFYELGELGHYAIVRTVEINKVFRVFVNERPLLELRAFVVHRGARVSEIVQPSKCKANFSGVTLDCMGPEIQLMDIYAALCDPSRAGEWPDLLDAEEKMRTLFEKEAGLKLKGATASRGGVSGGASGDANGRQSTPSRKRLVRAILEEFVPRTGHALVGEAAVGANPRDMPARVRVVSQNDFADEREVIQAIAERAGVAVQTSVNDPKIPTDPRLRRMTVYLTRAGDQRDPVLDIYNAAEFQLMGVIPGPGGRPAATLFGVMRFHLVEAWTIQLLFRMGFAKEAYTQKVLRETVEEYRRCVREYRQAVAAERFADIFPEEFIGRFQDPMVLAKRENFARGKPRPGKPRQFMPPFIPARNARIAAERDAAERDAAERDTVEGGAAKGTAAPFVSRDWINPDYIEEVCSVDSEELTAAAAAAYKDLVRGKKAVPAGQRPHIIVTIGAPGAGKSSVAAEIATRRGTPDLADYVEIDMDTALKYHPRYRDLAFGAPSAVTGDPTRVGLTMAYFMCNTPLEEILTELYQKILEGPKHYNVILQTHVQVNLIEAKLAGFDTSLLYVGVPLRIAIARSRERAAFTGKFLAPTLPEQDEIVESMWRMYKLSAVWYGLWADEFLVADNRDAPRGAPNDAPRSVRAFDLHECRAAGARRATGERRAAGGRRAVGEPTEWMKPLQEAQNEIDRVSA